MIELSQIEQTYFVAQNQFILYPKNSNSNRPLIVRYKIILRQKNKAF